MKKIFIGLVIVLGLAVLGLSLSLNSIITTAVEKVGSQVTGTEVALDASDISVFSGEGSLRGLSVANPQGFSSAKAFSLGEISVRMDTSTVLDDVVVINSVRVVNPTVVYELGKKRTNLDALLANVQANTPGSGTTSGSAESGGQGGSGEGASAKKVIIDDLLVTGGRVDVRMSSLNDALVSASLPEIHLTNLGRDTGGVDPEQVLRQLVAQVQKATVQAVPNPAKLLKNALENPAGKAADKIRSTGEAVEDKVKGLFGKE